MSKHLLNKLMLSEKRMIKAAIRQAWDKYNFARLSNEERSNLKNKISAYNAQLDKFAV